MVIDFPVAREITTPGNGFIIILKQYVQEIPPFIQTI